RQEDSGLSSWISLHREQVIALRGGPYLQLLDRHPLPRSKAYRRLRRFPLWIDSDSFRRPHDFGRRRFLRLRHTFDHQRQTSRGSESRDGPMAKAAELKKTDRLVSEFRQRRRDKLSRQFFGADFQQQFRSCRFCRRLGFPFPHARAIVEAAPDFRSGNPFASRSFTYPSAQMRANARTRAMYAVRSATLRAPLASSRLNRWELFIQQS